MIDIVNPTILFRNILKIFLLQNRFWPIPKTSLNFHHLGKFASQVVPLTFTTLASQVLTYKAKFVKRPGLEPPKVNFDV